MLSIVSMNQGTKADQQSKNTRIELWKQSIQSIRRHFISGMGLRGASFIVADPLTGVPSEWTESHNIYLQLAVEEGLIGVAIAVWILTKIIGTIGRMSDSNRAYFFSILVAFLVAGLTESWMNDKEIAMIFWTFVGYAVVDVSDIAQHSNLSGEQSQT